MAKWADFLISGVLYTEADKKKNISHVQVYEDKGNTVGLPFTLTRDEMLNKIDSNYSFKTTYVKDGKYSQGENVRKVKIKDNVYLRTDRDEIEEDNLENLPLL